MDLNKYEQSKGEFLLCLFNQQDDCPLLKVCYMFTVKFLEKCTKRH